MTDTGFPNGTFHLKQFRLTDSSALDLLSSQQETKFAAIKPLLDAFPQRVFILIGDSGEQDPEIYGRIGANTPIKSLVSSSAMLLTKRAMTNGLQMRLRT